MTYDELVTNIRNYTEVGSNVFTNAVINTYGAGATYFPGNSAGGTATGGLYA